MNKNIKNNYHSLIACPYCKDHLFKNIDSGSLVCSINPRHTFFKNKNFYNFVIETGDVKKQKKWSNQLKNIYRMREQIKSYGSYNPISDDVESVANFLKRFIKESDRILELGCGNGVMKKYFDDQTYFGLDPIFPDLICFNYINGIVEKMPLKTNSFAINFCKDSLSYFRDLSSTLDEISRVLEQNGIFIITEFVGKYYHKPIILFFRKFIRMSLNRLKGRIDWEDTFYKFRLKNEIMKSILKSNFDLIEEKYIPQEQRMYIVLKNNK